MKDIEGKFVDSPAGRAVRSMWSSLEPLAAESGFVFEDATKGGVAPREHIPSVERVARSHEYGCAGGLSGGGCESDPDVWLDHDVDSSEMAFRMAGDPRLQRGRTAGGPGYLEPVMHVEVETPEEYAGNITAISSLAAWRRDGQSSTAARLFALTSRWLRCLVMPPRCARCPRGARRIRWNSIICGVRGMWRMRLLREACEELINLHGSHLATMCLDYRDREFMPVT
ncbi:hypothetical protein ACVXG7_26575 [Enterobacter hormaechei]